MTDQEKVRVNFGGETHSIDGVTFLNSLSSFITICEEINQEVNGQEDLKVEINALEEGSFEVLLDIIASVNDAAGVMFTGVTSVDDVINIVEGIYSLRYFFNGKKPKEVEEGKEGVTVTNQEGDQTNISSNVYNIYTNNFSVNEALNNNFDALNNDESITEFSIRDKKGNIKFSADREDFSNLTDQDFEEIEENEKAVRTRHSLVVFKVVFGKKYTWQFIHKGNKINAKVRDGSFMKKIESGDYRFGKGDILEVELEILKVFDPTLGAFINKKYQVNKVYDHIPRANQGNLGLNN